MQGLSLVRTSGHTLNFWPCYVVITLSATTLTNDVLQMHNMHPHMVCVWHLLPTMHVQILHMWQEFPSTVDGNLLRNTIELSVLMHHLCTLVHIMLDACNFASFSLLTHSVLCLASFVCTIVPIALIILDSACTVVNDCIKCTLPCCNVTS